MGAGRRLTARAGRELGHPGGPSAGGLADQVVALGDVRRAPGGLGVGRGGGGQVAAPARAGGRGRRASGDGRRAPRAADRSRAARRRGRGRGRPRPRGRARRRGPGAPGRPRARRGRRTSRGSAASRSPRRCAASSCRAAMAASIWWRPGRWRASADCRMRTPSAISRVSQMLRSWWSSVTIRAVGVESRRQARVAQEHEREQPARLGFVGLERRAGG